MERSARPAERGAARCLRPTSCSHGNVASHAVLPSERHLFTAALLHCKAPAHLSDSTQSATLSRSARLPHLRTTGRVSGRPGVLVDCCSDVLADRRLRNEQGPDRSIVKAPAVTNQ